MTDGTIIRPFHINSQQDYQALAAFYKYAYPQESVTSNALRSADTLRPNKYVCQRYFVERNGIIIGVGSFEHWREFYHPDKYLLHLIVDPNFQRQSIGSTLYFYTIEQLEKLKPLQLNTWIRMDRESSIRFAEKHGFSKVKLKWNLVLDVKACDLEPLTKYMETLRKDGIEIKQLSQLENDFDRDRKLYNLYARTISNVENVDEVRILSFDEFMNEQNQRSDELTFVALHNNQYVGIWRLKKSSPDTLFGALGGVDEEYRRRAVGLALVIHSIMYAKANNYSTFTTYISEFNKASVALVEKLGFTHLPADISFRKEWTSL